MSGIPEFTVAICTYNRSGLLNNALESLARCKLPRRKWELLIIDNNSKDRTREIALSFQSRLPLSYLHEPEQGLSAARNRAMSECRGKVLLFTDDDVRLDGGWLQSHEIAFCEKNEAGWYGGRINPYWPNGRPGWLRDESMDLIAGLIVYYDIGETNRWYRKEDQLPFGANFAIRRELFENIGYFRTDLGVKAGAPGRSEETEYLQRARDAGYKGYYVGEALALHWQDPYRFKWLNLYKFGFQKGLAAGRMGATGHRKNHLRKLDYATKAIWQLLKGRGDRARQCVINVGIQSGLDSAQIQENSMRESFVMKN